MCGPERGREEERGRQRARGAKGEERGGSCGDTVGHPLHAPPFPSPLMAGAHMLSCLYACCSASHGVADGSSIASFLLNWAMVSCGGTRLPLAPFDRALISAPAASSGAVDGEGKEGEAQTEELSMSEDFVEVGCWERDTRQWRAEHCQTKNTHVNSTHSGCCLAVGQVGFWGRMSLIGSSLWNEMAYTHVSIYFSAAELDNIKQRCMEPLQGQTHPCDIIQIYVYACPRHVCLM